MEDDTNYPEERLYRGSMYKDALLNDEKAISFSDPKNWRSYGITIRLVHDTDALRVRRGGDSFDQPAWARKNASTVYEVVVHGLPGIRLSRDI